MTALAWLFAGLLFALGVLLALLLYECERALDGWRDALRGQSEALELLKLAHGVIKELSRR